MSNDSKRVPRVLMLNGLWKRTIEFDHYGDLNIQTEDGREMWIRREDVSALRDWLLALHLEEEGMQL